MGGAAPAQDPHLRFTKAIYEITNYTRKNVRPPCYTTGMLGKRNEARRKAESKHLFGQMLKAGKHTIITPKQHRGTRQSNNNKAIRESRDNG